MCSVVRDLEKEVKSDVTATGKYPAEACSDRCERKEDAEWKSLTRMAVQEGASSLRARERERERELRGGVKGGPEEEAQGERERGAAHSEAQRGEGRHWNRWE